MWVTPEFCFVGLLNFSSDQSFYTNSAWKCIVLCFFPLEWSSKQNRIKLNIDTYSDLLCPSQAAARLLQPLHTTLRVCLCVWVCMRARVCEPENVSGCKGTLLVLYTCVCMHMLSVCMPGLPSCDRVLYAFSGSNGPQLAFTHWSQAGSPT